MQRDPSLQPERKFEQCRNFPGQAAPHADVRITEKIYAPICGKFLAGEASKLGRYMGPLLLREVSDAKSHTA